MKQTAAILLLLLLVFNITGYQLTVQWMQQKQNDNLETQLDSDAYDEASLIELSVPLSLPYYNNSDFERYNGEIEINGTTYKYVKRKVQDGHLIVKCLPNPQQQAIQKNVSELFSQINGLPASDASSKAVKKIIKAGQFEYEATILPEVKNTSFTLIEKDQFVWPYILPQHICFPPWQPPEMIG